MPVSLDSLKGDYFLRDSDSDFALGRRSHLVYALPTRRISFTYLNQGGPEPITYLEYARRDIADRTQQGAINALGHAKRAVHLIMDKLLEVYCLDEWVNAPFPVRAELLRDIGAFPTRMVSRLNRDRNFMEHDYSFVEVDRAADFVELVELFLTMAYPFFRRGVIGAYVGNQHNMQCIEYFIKRKAKELVVADVAVDSYIDVPIGRVHYNMPEPGSGTPRLTVPLTRNRQSDWMSYLDILVYCTRREMLRLPQPDSRGPGVYYSDLTMHLPTDETGNVN